MIERHVSVMWNAQQGHQVLSHAWTHAKNLLIAGHRLVLEIREETRSDAQNRLLHSRLNDISKQCEWAGRKWDIDSWKRLLTAAWCRARNEGVELVPAIDGKGFDALYQRTSKLSRRDCAELSEYVLHWGDSQGVNWSVASLGGIDPDTGEIMKEAA